MARIKVIEHGCFFKNNKLRTKCTCGCVYLTPKRKVTKRYAHFRDEEYFYTDCPECGNGNTQYVKELRKELEGKDENI